MSHKRYEVEKNEARGLRTDDEGVSRVALMALVVIASLSGTWFVCYELGRLWAQWS